jgi:DNA-binding CsgD family transcriptional regulator
MDSNDRAARVLDQLYASVLDEALFPRALRGLVALVGASGIAQVKYELATGAVLGLESEGVDLATQVEYQSGVSQLDIRLPAAAALPPGRVMTEYTLVDPHLYRRSAIHDFLWRRDVPHMMATWVAKTRETATVLSLLRSRRQGEFTDPERQGYSALQSQVMRSLQIREALQAARATRRALLDVIDDLPFGVVLLDSRQRVLESSAVAVRLLREAACLQYVAGGIRAVRADADRRLQLAIGRAIAGEGEGRGDTIALRGVDRRRTESVAVLPVRSPQLFGAETPACMLILFDPLQSILPAVERVRHALNLSAAEALLACTLFKGVSLREAAFELQRSINTCKSQLKSIYAKTGCRSQVDLAKALLVIGMARRG